MAAAMADSLASLLTLEMTALQSGSLVLGKKPIDFISLVLIIDAVIKG